MVFLRWWRVIDQNDDDNEKWVFESRDQKFKANKFDFFFFWSVQGFGTFFWLFICFVKIFSFSFFWFVLALSNFALYFTNLVAYYKCRKDHKKKMDDLMGGSFKMSSLFVKGIKNKLGLK